MATKIIRGEDRDLNFTLSQQKGRFLKAYDLNSVTKVQAIFKTYRGENLVIDNTPAHGRFASAVYEEINFTADNMGEDGNLINLNFDGVKTIAQVLSEWNTANPANPLSSDADDATLVLESKTLELKGGRNEFSKIEIVNAIDGKIKVLLENDDTNSLNIGNSQDVGFILDFGDHDLGTRRKAVAKNAIDVSSESF